MAPLRVRSSNRFVPLLVLALSGTVTAFHVPSIEAASRGSAQGQACAYVPQAVWARGDGITTRLGTSRGTIYVFHPSTSARDAGRPIPKPKEYWAYDAKLSPQGDLTAFYGEFPSTIGGPGRGVGVVDRDGTIVEWIECGEALSWSPDGRWLAVVLSKWGKGGGPTDRRLALWNRRTGSVRMFDAAPSHVGWASEDSLLLQLGNAVDVIDPRTGNRSGTGHHGTIVSTDGLYALWPGENGQNTKVFEEETGYDVTIRLFGPMTQRGLGEIRSAFWMRGEGSDHFMVVSGCDHVYGPSPTCKTAIVDARTGEIVVEFPGEALGPTGDGKSAVLLRHGSYEMEGVDLEALLGLFRRPGGYY